MADDGYHVAGRTDYDRWQSALKRVAELERENAVLVELAAKAIDYAEDGWLYAEQWAQQKYEPEEDIAEMRTALAALAGRGGKEKNG